MKIKSLASIKFIILAILFTFAAIHMASASEETITVVYPKPLSELDQRIVYPLEVLKLVLSKNNSEFKLQPSRVAMTQNRALKMLALGVGVDVVWSMTNEIRETNLTPIRVPLYKGLIGWRLLLIKSENQTRFDKLNTLAELRRYIAGQGHDWPDTDILAANGFRIVSSSSYEGLFEMLEKNRFDFFPRSIIEIGDELKSHTEYNLSIEKTLLLHYPAAFYFFINRANSALKTRLENGFNTAISDGSFDALFYKYNQQHIQQANIQNRKILKLHNPNLPSATQLDNAELWLTPTAQH
ncbi:amino acid ABC transporter substrate-binding protein [Catenovulum sediminis]|uniref:amino acid ABC transporter substrate-binding protein n=1 Tax=Catenovulum sediminis TaxID=1740262 RepID=UPI00117E97B8|nr:amino acid ABC transporter substrate-binding protein [Catenovulum sediminis]